MPSITTEEALKRYKGTIYTSSSRLQIALTVDELFLKAIQLFDLASISHLDRWLIGYARNKLFQKCQTLFQMGKQKQLLALLDYAEKAIPQLRELAKNPDVWVTVSGKMINPVEAEKQWDKPVPKWVRKLLRKTVFLGE